MSRRTAAQIRQSGIPTLGDAVYRRDFVPEDRRGQYVGAGTQVNVAAGLFNSKKQVAITEAWAQVLNDLVRSGQGNGNTRGFVADPDARITVNPETGQTFVPGSEQQLQSRSALGLASVRNPMGVPQRTGSKVVGDRRGTFMRVGGDKYRTLIRAALENRVALSRDAVDRLLYQGYLYGLAGPLIQLGVVNAQGQIVNPGAFDALAIKNYYDQFMKNPDQQRLGYFASASAARNHAGLGHIIDKSTNQPMDPRRIKETFENNGTVTGWGWAEGFKSSKQRAGLTSHPLRTADGRALQGPVMDRNAGECNVYGSGPGMGGNGEDDFQLRLYKSKRSHRSKSAKNLGGVANEKRTLAAPTYFCGPTKAEVIDSDRKIYRAGGKRGGDVGLAPALNAISAQIGDPNVSAAALAREYNTWSNDPNAFAPQFRVPTDIRGREGKSGFARFQPVGLMDRQAGRAASDQFTNAQSNRALPAQYKASGNAPAGNYSPFAPMGTAAPSLTGRGTVRRSARTTARNQ